MSDLDRTLKTLSHYKQAETSFQEALQNYYSQSLRSSALSRALGIGAGAAGVGLGVRGLLGLLNLGRGNISADDPYGSSLIDLGEEEEEKEAGEKQAIWPFKGESDLTDEEVARYDRYIEELRPHYAGPAFNDPDPSKRKRPSKKNTRRMRPPGLIVRHDREEAEKKKKKKKEEKEAGVPKGGLSFASSRLTPEEFEAKYKKKKKKKKRRRKSRSKTAANPNDPSTQPGNQYQESDPRNPYHPDYRPPGYVNPATKLQSQQTKPLTSYGSRGVSGPAAQNLRSFFGMNAPSSEKSSEWSKQAGLMDFLKGQYAETVKGVPWALPAAVGAGAGGLYGGWKLMDYVLDQRRKSKLDDELEEAKAEYEAALSGSGKTAAAGSLALDLDQLYDNISGYGEKAAASWPEISGRAMGMYGTGAGVGALIMALLGYKQGKKKQRKTILMRAQARKRREEYSRRPDPLYVRTVGSGAAPKVDEGSSDAAPSLDEIEDQLL